MGVETFSLGQPSLDEVFLALTGKPAEEKSKEASQGESEAEPGEEPTGTPGPDTAPPAGGEAP